MLDPLPRSWPSTLASILGLPALAPNLGLPVLATYFYLPSLAPNLYLPAVAPNLRLPVLASNLCLPSLAPNLCSSALTQIYFYQSCLPKCVCRHLIKRIHLLALVLTGNLLIPVQGTTFVLYSQVQVKVLLLLVVTLLLPPPLLRRRQLNFFLYRRYQL